MSNELVPIMLAGVYETEACAEWAQDVLHEQELASGEGSTRMRRQNGAWATMVKVRPEHVANWLDESDEVDA